MVGSSTIRNYKGISGASIVSFCTDTSKYTVNFDWKQIETTVTDNATVVDQWVQGINDLYPANESVIVGLNVERSARKNRSATLHLCVDSKCLIVQLLYIGELPLSLKNFFIKPNFFFVGILIAKNISRIHDEYGGLSSGSVHADIKELAIQKWPDRWNLLGLEDLCSSVLGLIVVGLDVEWRPNYSRYMDNNKSATLQLCIDEKCLILQLFYIDNLTLSLKNFLMNPNFTFVGVEVGDDISKIRNEYDLNCLLL
ncbi:hypothetical protein HN51_011990 [Arachis hypogaea]